MIKINFISNINNKNQIIDTIKNKINEKIYKIDVEKLFDINEDIELPLYIDSKEGLDKFVLHNSESYKTHVPKWLSGFSNEKCVYIAINEDNLDETIKTGVHELIHLISYHLKINGTRIKLLEEGLAYYYANQMTVGQFQILKNDFTKETIKTFKELIPMNSEDFAKNNGYYYGFFLVKFLNNIYGYDKIIFYIKNSNQFIEDLDILQKNFIDYMLNEFKKYE